MVQPTLFFVNDPSAKDSEQGAQPSQQFIRTLIRSDSHYLVSSYSNDYGMSWSKPELTNIPNPHSGVDAVRVAATGDILLINNDSMEKRNPINVWRSVDQGKTFKNVLTLDNDPKCEGFSYPAVIQSYIGYVHITYTWVCRHLSSNVRIKHVVLDPKRL